MFQGTRNGLFWLFDKPEQRVQGTVNISDKGRLELTTQGLLDLTYDRNTSLTICGTTESGHVTLVDAQRNGTENRIGRFTEEVQETWLSGYAIQSVSNNSIHLNEELNDEIVSIDVEIQSLPDWAHEGRTLRFDRGKGSLSWSVDQPSPRTNWSMGEVAIRHVVDTSQYGRAQRLRSAKVAIRTSFIVKFDQPSSVEVVQDTVSSLQALVSVASGEAVAIQKISLTTNTGKSEQRLLLHYEPILRPLDPAARDSALFTMDELSGIKGVGRWLDSLCNQTHLKNGLLADRYRIPTFVTDKTLHLLLACEAHQRQITNNPRGQMNSLDKVLPECDLAGREFSNWIGDWNRWRARIRRIRSDQIAHLQGYAKPRGGDGDIGTINRQLFAYLVISVLIQCGVSEEVIEWVAIRSSSEAVMHLP